MPNHASQPELCRLIEIVAGESGHDNKCIILEPSCHARFFAPLENDDAW
nr:hypothetical protein [Clostridia bacterium]